MEDAPGADRKSRIAFKPPFAANRGTTPRKPTYNSRVGEFDLIERYFARGPSRDDVLIGIGDDAALVDAGAGHRVMCAIAARGTADAGTPAPEACELANYLVCAAFNRLASRGIAPAWYTLALCLPRPLDEWLERFSGTLFAAASPCGAALVGGDTTRGPLAATLVAHGVIGDAPSPDLPLPMAGSAVYMTGEIGRRWPATPKGSTPEGRTPHRLVPPRVDAGIRAFAHASAAADIRLSLASTLRDILDPFELGVRLQPSALPVAAESARLIRRPGGAKLLAETAADYELCFIVVPAREPGFRRAMQALSTPCARIGVVTNKSGVRIDGAEH